MGVRPLRLAGFVVLAGWSAGVVCAEPALRLSSAALGPLSIALNSDGPPQLLEAYNAGDGSLNLTVQADVSWLAPAAGAARPCTAREGACIPITIALRTASLAKGIHTGVVTVSDPNAWDAPQTVTVTVQMGGGVPDRAELLVPPDGSADSVRFETNSLLQARVATESGGNWLSLVLDGLGSFRFVLPYRIEARHLPGMGEGTYNGAVEITGSAFPGDLKTVPVTLRVTSAPIAAVLPPRLDFRVARGAIKPQGAILITNRGQGTLAISGVRPTTASGGDWLAAKVEGTSVVTVSADPANLAPGRYEGAVEIASNAANAPLRVPVRLQVVEQGPPLAVFGGVANNTFAPGDPIAQGGIASIYGEQFRFGDPVQGTIPLAEELGGVKVFVNGVAARLFYVSYGQINFQMPFEIPPGRARVTVMRDGQAGNVVTAEVAERAPLLLRLGLADYGILVNQDGTFPIPPTPGIPSRPAKPGDALVAYAIGFGQTDPAVATGAASPAAEPLARIVPAPTVFFGAGLTGGVAVTPFYAGLTPNFVGLFQINVIVPDNAPRGDRVPFRVEGPGYRSNTVELAIQ
jgi:uncharacterized protein (TIGR03437 family)